MSPRCFYNFSVSKKIIDRNKEYSSSILRGCSNRQPHKTTYSIRWLQKNCLKKQVWVSKPPEKVYDGCKALKVYIHRSNVYIFTSKFTTKSDHIYSFGIILLKLIVDIHSTLELARICKSYKLPDHPNTCTFF